MYSRPEAPHTMYGIWEMRMFYRKAKYMKVKVEVQKNGRMIINTQPWIVLVYIGASLALRAKE